MNMLRVMLLLATLLLCETTTQTLLNSSVPGQGHFIKRLTETQCLILGMIGYAIVGFVYSRILNQFRKSERGLNIANSLWNIGNQICIALVGVLFFKEKLTAINWVGNILMAIGLGLVVY